MTDFIGVKKHPYGALIARTSRVNSWLPEGRWYFDSVLEVATFVRKGERQFWLSIHAKTQDQALRSILSEYGIKIEITP